MPVQKISFPHELHEQIKLAAMLEGLTVSAWLRRVATLALRGE